MWNLDGLAQLCDHAVIQDSLFVVSQQRVVSTVVGVRDVFD
jgi:hypothetical protein